MIKSTVYNIVAWAVLVLGLFLGFFAGSSADDLMQSLGQGSSSDSAFLLAMIITWLIAFVMALILFYFAASLYHLEKINDQTSRLLETSESNRPIKIAAQTVTRAYPPPFAPADKSDDELKFRCMLCGKKYDGKDDATVCPECKKFLAAT